MNHMPNQHAEDDINFCEGQQLNKVVKNLCVHNKEQTPPTYESWGHRHVLIRDLCKSTIGRFGCIPMTYDIKTRVNYVELVCL